MCVSSGGGYMRRPIMISISMLVLSYSICGVVTAAESQQVNNENEEMIFSDNENIISENRSFLSDETVSANLLNEKDSGNLLNQELELDDEPAVIISENENADIAKNEIIDEVLNVNDLSEADEQDKMSVSLDESVSSNIPVSNNEIGDVLKEGKDDSLSDNDSNGLSSEKDRILKVKFPMATRIYLDPGNLLGEDDIFSDHYKVTNYGNRDVLIKIENVEIVEKWGEDLYDLSADTPNDIYSDKLKVNLNMVWKNEKEKNVAKTIKVTEGNVDGYAVYLRAAQYDANNEFVKTNEGSEGEFYFTGNLENKDNVSWENSRVLINFSYEIIDDEEEISEFLNTDNEDKINKEAKINE